MERLGLCLTGGGARGAYQAGALKALEELGYLDKVYAISGTSIGSVNASLLASRSVDEIKELWLNYPASDFNKDTSIFKTIRERKMDIVNQGVYEINALEKLLEENIDIQKLKKHKVYVTLSPAGMENEGVMGLLKSSFKHYIKNESQVIYSPLHEQNDEDINKQILASCSIPFVFPSVKMEGQQVFDGGLYDNAPVKPLIDAGCDSIIVIHLLRMYFINKHKYPGINFYEIKHWRSLGGVLNFDGNQAEKRFNLGYDDTIKFFKENPIK
ncbi:MAG: patatin-like phospholipase family protein [Candidatus Izemoplasmatales bacterium]|nr:patatin-like phospholipase family protein [Candidatus Izemoplasmatales bacterium]MDD4070423.1 patatin-like phospholipase family protein [Candidatus Izemoplasmatales bacterium]MDY0138948.1 patatin-like phospholipase family protein [Candidatus Izemoplasmatales bacterium]